MQTFLPLPSFSDSARVLDRLRLGKQRVEVFQILRTLRGESRGYLNHPAVRMWRGHEEALGRYGLAICREWTRRGYRDTLAPRICHLAFATPARICRMPQWILTPHLLRAVNRSHRSNLLRKAPEHYAVFGWKEAPDLDYVWPV